MNIEVVLAEVTHVPTAKGGYDKLNVTYRSDGKVNAKNLVSFNTPKEVWDALKGAEKGATFGIETVKNDKGYWDWTGIARQDGIANLKEDSVEKPQTKSYVPDTERQRMIVRQVALKAAVDFAVGAGIHDKDALIQHAEELNDWLNLNV